MADVTGGEAIRRLLDKVDVPGRIEEIKRDLPDASTEPAAPTSTASSSTCRPSSRRGLKPSDAFVVSKVPVLPPAMRPIYADERGTLISSDINTLYRDVGAVSEKLREVKDLPDRHKGPLRQDLYDGVKAMQGLGDPISENPALKGIFRQLSGRASPKGGFFQGAGRAVTPEPQRPRHHHARQRPLGRPGGAAGGDGLDALPGLRGARARGDGPLQGGRPRGGGQPHLSKLRPAWRPP